jgi:hypothetical protein
LITKNNFFKSNLSAIKILIVTSRCQIMFLVVGVCPALARHSHNRARKPLRARGMKFIFLRGGFLIERLADAAALARRDFLPRYLHGQVALVDGS